MASSNLCGFFSSGVSWQMYLVSYSHPACVWWTTANVHNTELDEPMSWHTIRQLPAFLCVFSLECLWYKEHTGTNKEVVIIVPFKPRRYAAQSPEKLSSLELGILRSLAMTCDVIIVWLKMAAQQLREKRHASVSARDRFLGHLWISETG